MKKLSHALLVALLALSFSNQAAEKPSVSSNNILCDLLGIGCSVITTTSDSDNDGSGKEPPKQG